MSILKDVLAELFGMFMADMRLTAAILAVVALAAVLIDTAAVTPLVGGAVLLLGTLTILFVAVLLAARQK